MTLGSLCRHFWHLGRLWGHFGVTLEALAACGGDFGSLDGHFAIIVDTLWVYEGPLSKNSHCPYIF